MCHGAWRALPAAWLRATGAGPTDPDHVSLLLGRAMLALVSGDVIRPSPGWLSSPGTPRGLLAELSRSRDPDGFSALKAVAKDSLVNAHTMGLALRRVAAIAAAKGGTVAEITVGDCLELLRVTEDVQLGADATSPYFYQLLRNSGLLADGPPAARALRTLGQLSCAALIDRYGLECAPVRDLLVDYLAERRPALDYASLHKLSYTLGRLFWRDLELHHPGISSLGLPADVARGWKVRITTKTTRVVGGDGVVSRVSVPRVNAVDHLMTVRAFYLDLTEWAVEDPGRWAPWVHPCPVSATEIAPQRKSRVQRKSRMDQRTRERLPVLPALVAYVQNAATAAAEALAAGQPRALARCSAWEAGRSAGLSPATALWARSGRRSPRLEGAGTSASKSIGRSGPGPRSRCCATRASASRSSRSSATTASSSTPFPAATRWSRSCTSCPPRPTPNAFS